MSVLTDLQKLLLLCFVGTSMLSVGLRSGIAELRVVARARGFMARALLANFLLVPLLGFGLAHMLRLPPETAGALILLACVPGGLNAIHFTSKVEGEATVAETLFALMTIAAVVGSPWVVRLVLPATAAWTSRTGAPSHSSWARSSSRWAPESSSTTVHPPSR